MELEQEITIPAERERVWTALNDPLVLQQCLPGCEQFELTAAHEYDITMAVKVGPVKARFKGAIRLDNVVEGQSYTIAGEGKGGVAGFATGSANVQLQDDPADSHSTLLHYVVDARVGGKLAQIGARLVDGAAKKLAEDFFARFREIVSA